jgi:hypothetical protein
MASPTATPDVDEKAVALLMSLGLKEQYAREQARNKKTVKIFMDVLKEVR